MQPSPGLSKNTPEYIKISNISANSELFEIIMIIYLKHMTVEVFLVSIDPFNKSYFQRFVLSLMFKHIILYMYIFQFFFFLQKIKFKCNTMNSGGVGESFFLVDY